MNWNKIRAIAIGAMAGGLLVHLFAPAGIWYLLGVPGGAAIGWLVYCFPAILRETPRAWANMTSKASLEALFGILSDISVAGITSIGAAFSVGTTLFALGWLMGFHFTPPPGKAILSVLLLVMVVWGGTVFIVAALSRERSLCAAIRNYRKTAVFANPPGLTYLVLRGLWWTIPRIPNGIRAVAAFCTRLFVRVHSNDALDCAIYAATGPLLAAFITKEWWIIGLSALIGIVCALILGRIANILRRTYPALS